MVGGLEHGGGQFGRIALALHLGHAEAGTGTRRLDEQRVAQAGGLDLGHDGRGVGGEPVRGVKGTRIQRDARRRGDAGGVQQHLGVMLVHARGRSKHAAANVRHVHHLQQALNGAVLAVRAVQHRQHRIDVAEGFDGVAADQEPVAATAHVQQHRTRLRGDLDLGQRVAAQVPAARVLAVDDPLAGLGDADRNRFETLGVHRLQDAGGRDAGDRMLIRLAAVQHHDALLSHAAHVLCLVFHSADQSTDSIR